MANRRRVNYTGRPTPRRQQRRPNDKATAFVCLLIIALLGLLTWWGLTSTMPTEAEQTQEHKITHDSLCATFTYDGEVVRWYVFVDPEYGTQWIYNDHDWRAFPRIDANGAQIGLQNQSDYE